MKRPKVHDVGRAHKAAERKTRSRKVNPPTIGCGEDQITGANRGRGGLGE